MFSVDEGFLDLGSCFSEDQRFFWVLAHVFRGPKILDPALCFQRTKGFLGFGSCFQRTKGFGSWLMFSEDLGFLGFGSCFQRTKGSGSCLMFSEDEGFFGLWLVFSED